MTRNLAPAPVLARPEAVLAPWTLARVAGLPAATCDLVGPETPALLDRQEALTGVLAELGGPVADACYELVPSLDDAPPLRRLALAAKRAAFKGSALPKDVTELTARMPEPAREAVDEYQRTAAELARVRDELASSVAADGERARAALVAPLGWDPFVRSVALAAPEWAEHGLGKARSGRLDARNLRTLYSYVTRTALKTSPYSRLTTVALPGVSTTASRSYAGAAVAYTALHAVAREHGLARLLRYRVAPRANSAQGRFVAHGQAEGLGALPWMSLSIAHAAAAPAWLADADDERDYELPELLALLGGRDPWARFLRALDSGWVHPVACWHGGGDPLDGLLAAVEVAENRHPMTREIRRVHRSAAALAGSPATERTAALAAVRQAQASWRAMSGLRLWTSDLVYEDAATGFAVPDPFGADGTDGTPDLAAFAAELRPRMFRSHLYDFLLTAFVSRFGRGGRCADLFGFLASLAVEDRAEQAMAAAAAKDLTDGSGRAWLPVGSTSAPPTTGVLFQLADTERGRYLVVNQLCDGVGGMVSRFTGVLGDRLAAALREWYAALWPGVPRHEYAPSRACTTAQHASAGLLPALAVPGDGMPGRPGDLRLRDVALVHDADRDVLELLDPDGCPFGLVPAGLVPSRMSSGVQRLLTVLADPWVRPLGFGDSLLPFDLPVREEVVARPRRTIGRVVVERASWLCPAGQFPRPEKGDRDADTVARADRWRRAHGIPAEVFCRPVEDFRAKPLWADLRSAVSLAVLGRELPGTGRIRVVEALPGKAGHPLRSPSGDRLACEYLAGLRWPRPEGAA
ncbi:lantibiotic dehydratase [Amycolatopsis sp. GA6-003]|uniref:lantibiotic dehydratase n=1 Tax=Amycolatopsis sp. GA6-003 TaxID=2652444 RepID=UPI003916ECA8